MIKIRRILFRHFPRFLIPIFILSLLSHQTFGEAPSADEVRVRVGISYKSIGLRGEGLILKKDLYTRSLDENQIRIKRMQDPGGVWQWRVESGTDAQPLQLVMSDELEVLSKVPMLSELDGLPAKIKLVAISGKPQFHVVGSYSMTDYLSGVVAAEMPLAWPVEALKAQLVAARSYTLSVMKTRQRRSWDVEKGVQDQAFDPTFYSRIPAVYVRRLRQAVAATDGEYLVVAEPKAAMKAYYHAHCGGQTQSPKAKWGQGPAWGGVKDPQCATSASGSWTLQITKTALQERLRAGRLLPDQASLVALNLKVGSDHDRVEQVEFELPGQAKAVNVKAYDLRRVLGYSQMKSTRFEMRQEGEQLTFSGQGYGHGVGLCQWGAKHLAEKGSDYKKILSHYYPRAKITR